MGIRQKSRIFLAATAAVAAMPVCTFAARQKAMGLTSGAITATNPTTRQMQIICDPGAASLNVQSFQLGMQFDSTALDFLSASFQMVKPFSAQSAPAINGNLIDLISGSAVRTSTVPGDVNLFLLTFQLKQNAASDQPLNFTFGAFDPTDFITGVDTANPNNTQNDVTFQGMNIIPTKITGALAQNYATFYNASGNWSDASRWALGVLPTAGGIVALSGDAGQVVVTLDANAQAGNLTSLTLDASSGRSITLQQDGNTLTVNGPEIIGDNGSGVVNMTGGSHGAGTLTLGNADIAKGTFNLNGGTLSVGGDELIGNSGTGIFNQGGGTHTIGGTLNIAANAGSAGVYTQTGGSLTAGATINNGTFNNNAGTANLGALNGPGNLTVGAVGAGPAMTTVTNFNQNSVTLNSGSLVVTPTPSPQLNTASTVTINGGVMDLGNQNLLTSTPAATIRGYLVNAYSPSANWKGSGITSAGAIANPTKMTIGYTDGSDPANPRADVLPGKVLVVPTSVGDTNLDGSVNFGDILQILGAGKFNTGNAATYVSGDVNYGGFCDGSDLAAITNSGNYIHATLTGSPVGATIGRAGDGIPDFLYNSVTGDVKFMKDGLLGNFSALQLLSAGGKFNFGGGPFSGTFDVNSAGSLAGANFTAVGFADGYDLGNVLPAGLSNAQLAADLTLGYQIFGQGVGANALTPANITSVPEPTSVGLIALGAAGLLTRRRRHFAKPK